MIFSKNSPTRAHSTLLRPPRTPLPLCVRARALPVFSAPPIARVCHFADISDFRADVRNIALPPTFAFPHPLWRRSDRHFPVHIGDSEITRTGSLFRSRFAAVSRRLSQTGVSCPRPSPPVPPICTRPYRPSFPPVSLLLLLRSKVSSLHTHSLCFLFVPVLVSSFRRQIVSSSNPVRCRRLRACSSSRATFWLVQWFPVGSSTDFVRRLCVFWSYFFFDSVNFPSPCELHVRREVLFLRFPTIRGLTASRNGVFVMLMLEKN